MRSFWTVMKLELYLFWRSWTTWLIALAIILIGVLAADNNRNQPWGIWGQIVTVGMFLALILTFSTGNQINRDRERRLDGVIFSTPVMTTIYVLAKYSAALLSLLALTGLSLLAAMLTDQFYNVPRQVLFLSPVVYPSLGVQVYLLGWVWVMLVPVIFGAAFIFATITLTRGNRVAAYIVTLLTWLIPVFTASLNPAVFFDISATSFLYSSSPAVDFWIQHYPGGSPAPIPLPQFIQKIMPLARTEVPPAALLDNLLWNRLFFLGLAAVLLYITMLGVQRSRRNA
ncbi:MAG TPA: hypothetical protein VFA09_00180 [Ktedonobacteraceae bacterium]|jgi:hypothetical protein|nr:hypothetical protein [Ktedonobacteraceae bacterium]